MHPELTHPADRKRVSLAHNTLTFTHQRLDIVFERILLFSLWFPLTHRIYIHSNHSYSIALGWQLFTGIARNDNNKSHTLCKQNAQSKIYIIWSHHLPAIFFSHIFIKAHNAMAHRRCPLREHVIVLGWPRDAKLHEKRYQVTYTKCFQQLVAFVISLLCGCRMSKMYCIWWIA